MARDMVQVRKPTQNEQFKPPQMRYGRSQFANNKRHKTTFSVGNLIPYFLMRVAPGDTITLDLTAFLRIFSPLDAPIMDNIRVDIDYFYAPYRILWDNFKAFLGEHDAAGAQDTTYTFPVLASPLVFDDSQTGEVLGRYMGIPYGLDVDFNPICALPFRMYNQVYSYYYRDQNLIDQPYLTKGDGPDAMASQYVMQKSAKQPDYFTTGLPYLQKGSPVTVSLGTSARVATDASVGQEITVYSTAQSEDRNLISDATDREIELGSTNYVNRELYADLSAAQGISINALREAAAIQRFLEKDARGGSRYPEKMRWQFGVDVPDYTIQEPEYLGGGQGWINISPVANTSATATEDQAQLSGIGHGVLRAKVAKSFTEFGYIMGILRARGEVNYHQGLETHWSQTDIYDLMWPEFAQLGEQPIYNREIYVQNAAADGNVFAYQERYADWRWEKSLISGDLDPAVAGSVDFWHLAEDFGSAPNLNQAFIEDATPMSRVQTVPSAPDFIIDGVHEIRTARALPVRPVPTLMPARF